MTKTYLKNMRKWIDRIGLTSIPIVVDTYSLLRILCGKNNKTRVYRGKDGNFNWIREIYWNGSDWEGYSSHDWKYSIEMQEGALYFAIECNNNSLDLEIQHELEYIHKNISKDGTVIGLTNSNQYEYGIILSSLALGYLRFKGLNQKLANRTYEDMKKVYNYIKLQWKTPNNLKDYSLILRGLANAYNIFVLKDASKADEVKEIIKNYVDTFKNNQDADGFWDLGGLTLIQAQLKRNISVLLAYDVTLDHTYLDRVKNNLEWIKSNRWDDKTGGVKWGSTNYFFECHQMWFMIVVRYLYNKSKEKYNYLKDGEKAWKFLTDNNYANINMYIHNYNNYNAFFSYREIDSRGNIQSHYNFKGSYEIGTSLWGMALNYDLVKNYKSSNSNKPYNYLLKQIEQIKKSRANKGFFTDKKI